MQTRRVQQGLGTHAHQKKEVVLMADISKLEQQAVEEKGKDGEEE